jgi:hypothetical protein
LSKKIYDLEIDLKNLQIEKGETSEDPEIKEKKDKIDELYKELVTYEDENREDIIKYYITFTCLSDRTAAINILKEH